MPVCGQVSTLRSPVSILWPFLIATLLFLAPARATLVPADDDPLTLEYLVHEADLIIRAEAVEVQFRMSDGDPDAYSRLPHTWVTYRIDEIYRGTYQRDTITLRFLGGATGEDGRVMLLSGIPFFKVGDDDLLFITGNSVSICPLVACAAGRYRVHEDRLFTEYGHSVQLGEDGRVQPGALVQDGPAREMVIPPAPRAFIAAERRRLADLTDPTTRARTERYLDAISSERVLSMRASLREDHGPRESMSVADFVDRIRQLLPEAPQPVEVEDARFDEPVFVPHPPPARAEPAPIPAEPEVVPLPTELTRERLLYERSGRNPVLVPR